MKLTELIINVTEHHK